MSLKEAIKIQRTYFKEYSQEIALRNLKLMLTVCYSGIAIFIAYYLFTLILFPERMISIYYGVIVPVFALVIFRIKQIIKSGNIEFKNSQLITILMYVMVMIYTIIMSVVPHPELQAVYYPLFLLIGPVMFILPMYHQFSINGLSYIVFLLAVLERKPQSCWMHDLFECGTSLVFSVVLILLMTQFRVQSEGLKDKYYKLSRHDGLTGLLNKVTGTAIAKDYIENILVSEPFSMAVLDIDDFKTINDTYGHEKGDEVLEAVGKVLEMAFRKEDVVSRFGGDEFMVLLKNITRAEAIKRWDAFVDELAHLSSELGIPITSSIGVYDGISGSCTISDAIDKADSTLYEVKASGKNNYKYYNSSK